MFSPNAPILQQQLTTVSTSTAISAAPSYVPLTPFLANAKSTAANVTASLFRYPSAKHLTNLPFRIVSRLDRTVFHTIPRYILASTGLITWEEAAGTAANNAGVRGAGAGATVMVDAVNQATTQAAAAATANGGWKTFVADALQSSTFKSYWGMLHYLTSRWAFTCFVLALVLNRVSILH